MFVNREHLLARRKQVSLGGGPRELDHPVPVWCVICSRVVEMFVYCLLIWICSDFAFVSCVPALSTASSSRQLWETPGRVDLLSSTPDERFVGEGIADREQQEMVVATTVETMSEYLESVQRVVRPVT